MKQNSSTVTSIANSFPQALLSSESGGLLALGTQPSQNLKESGDNSGSSANLHKSTGSSSKNSGDLRQNYTNRTIEAFNQFSQYTKHTPSDKLDLRCEFDLPRFKDLTKLSEPRFNDADDH